PDSAYPNFTTAEGGNALKALTTVVGNTGVGTFSSFSLATGSFNTAVGAGSLDLNTADQNTATGSCPCGNVFGTNVSLIALISNVSATELLRNQIAGSRRRQLSHAFNATHRKVDPDGPAVNTIPHWSDSFTYNGLVYTYTMVGTDPRRGSATTVIPTVLIPL